MESTATRIGGYRVVRRLATGGTSDVLLAKAEGPHGFERTVVLKLLLSEYRDDERVAQMFAREAAAYARLSHPSIVQLFDFFAASGQLVMVLEYVDGPPLHRLRGMLKSVGQQIGDKGAIHVAMRIFSALAAAHAATDDTGASAPVIHRDVNPSNVLVGWDGQVKLADFGVAKVAGLSHQSVVGSIKGTFGYMAPEQIEGGAITPRADVYAAGIILWEMLTRRRAFQRGALPEVEVLRAMAEPRITSLDVLRPDLDGNVRHAVKLALEPNADRRKISAEEMVAVLRGAVSVDEGREHVSRALAAVRHEPRPSFSTMPPPMAATAPSPTVPRTAPRPRSVEPPRMTSPYGMTVLTPAPPSTEETKTQARVLPPVVDVRTTAVGPPVDLAATVRNEGASQAQAEAERLRLGTPIEAMARAAHLTAAIDEILSDARGQGIGVIPAPPPPLSAGNGAGALDRTLSMDTRPQNLPRLPLDSEEDIATVRPATPAMPPSLPFPKTTAMMLQRPAAGAPPPAPSARPQPPIAPLPQEPMHPAAPAPYYDVSPSVRPPMPSLLPPTPGRGGRGALFAVIGVAIVALTAGGFGFLRWQRNRVVTAPVPVLSVAPPTASVTAVTAIPVPPASSIIASATTSPPASAAVPVTASEATSIAPLASAAPTASSADSGDPSMGIVKTTGLAPDHRIYIDDRVVGQTPEPVKIKCGSHRIKIGSNGYVRVVDVPCGGEVSVTDR